MVNNAGRIMSRMDAKRKLNLKQEIEAMNRKGIIHNMNNVNDLESVLK